MVDKIMYITKQTVTETVTIYNIPCLLIGGLITKLDGTFGGRTNRGNRINYGTWIEACPQEDQVTIIADIDSEYAEELKTVVKDYFQTKEVTAYHRGEE